MATANVFQQLGGMGWVTGESFINIMLSSQSLKGGWFLNRWGDGVTSRQGVEARLEEEVLEAMLLLLRSQGHGPC